ncbi:MAG: hypothetical protein DPW18_16280 [Chloroflexi bacterium]|nr:hypothetical protein [Chloroflexota bacterium]MDL1940948.1 hypothetical protein [Chloroflexi bacterium CFX2]
MDIGRIYFKPNDKPTKAEIIPLETHVGNVQKLVEAWDHSLAYKLPAGCDLSLTRTQLIEAARRHDEAKPATFKVTFNGNKFGYSFAGHRFKVQCDDLYIDALIKMHHEFSVNGVTEWQARIRRELGEVYAANFPLDLYALEMCDQVAAEVECYAMEGYSDDRAFMELHSHKRDDGMIEIEPFPFSPSPLSLTVLYTEFDIPSELRGTESDKLNALTSALNAFKPDKQNMEKKVTLCQP